MTNDEALSMIRSALDKVSPGAGEKVSMDTHLVEDDVLDSLDVMNFLFELEQEKGGQIEGIDESFEDFRVSRIVELMAA
ncbi:MAG: hypothetical protein AAGF90_03210 [Pseudomonadota bacterium]